MGIISENLTYMVTSKFMMIYTTYQGYIIPVSRVETIFVGETCTKVSMYGKGLKVIRDNPFILDDLYLFLQSNCWLVADITLSRIDVTTDTNKIDFSIKCLLKTTKTMIFRWDGWIETKYFWSKKSNIFIRYYNKKKELSDKWYSWLYLEYTNVPEVMRYEIQLKGDWIPKEVRRQVDNLTWLTDIILNMWSPYPMLFKYKKGKADPNRAVELFNGFLKNLTSIYDITQVADKLDIIYNERYKQHVW